MDSTHFREQVLGQVVRVTVQDGRTFYGTFASLDRDMNIVLEEALCQLPAKLVSPLNGRIVNFSDSLKRPDHYAKGLTE
jgi:small nuclear ribonucleoprotein (snRNP)-like protein